VKTPKGRALWGEELKTHLMMESLTPCKKKSEAADISWKPENWFRLRPLGRLWCPNAPYMMDLDGQYTTDPGEGPENPEELIQILDYVMSLRKQGEFMKCAVQEDMGKYSCFKYTKAGKWMWKEYEVKESYYFEKIRNLERKLEDVGPHDVHLRVEALRRKRNTRRYLDESKLKLYGSIGPH
jgi:hypothetical protein